MCVCLHLHVHAGLRKTGNSWELGKGSVDREESRRFSGCMAVQNLMIQVAQLELAECLTHGIYCGCFHHTLTSSIC